MINNMMSQAAKSFFTADIVIYTVTATAIITTILAILRHLRSED